VPIATVYLDGNASSHFRPVRDSVRSYGPLLALTASSLLAFAVDTVAVLLLFGLTGSVVTAAVAARLLSASVNYGTNRAWVFRGRRRAGSGRRYALLAVAILAANAALLETLTTVTGSILLAKVLTELTLFAASFTAQRHLVFPEPDRVRERTRTPAL
jgi:putative flippase GtrA